jgi:hypothetical protein
MEQQLTVYYKTANVFTIRFFNSWTNILAFKLLNALITLSAAFFVSARTTPFPCVPSSNFTMSGNRLPF